MPPAAPVRPTSRLRRVDAGAAASRPRAPRSRMQVREAPISHHHGAPPMSSTLLATALVVPFEHLRMTDVEAVGGKNASLGEMISQLAASGVRVPGGFATTAHAFREFLKHQGLADAHRGAARGARHRRRAGARRGRRRDPRLDRGDAVSARARGGDPRRLRPLAADNPGAIVRGALVGHGRRPARRQLRRPAGDLPQRASASTRCWRR